VKKLGLRARRCSRNLLPLAISLILLASLSIALAAYMQPKGSLVEFHGIKVVKGGQTSTYDSLSLVISRCNQTISARHDNKLECQILLLHLEYDSQKNKFHVAFIVLDKGDIINPSEIVIRQSGKEQQTSEITLYGVPGESFNENELNKAIENSGLANVLSKIVKPYSEKLLGELEKKMEQMRESKTEATATVTRTVTTSHPGITITLPHPEILFSFAMAFLLLAMFLSILLAILAAKSV